MFESAKSTNGVQPPLWNDSGLRMAPMVVMKDLDMVDAVASGLHASEHSAASP